MNCYITHPVNYYPSIFLVFNLVIYIKQVHSSFLICKHITVCCDMQKNSQCEILHNTFHKWTWSSFHSKHIFLSQVACWIVSLSIKSTWFRYFYKLPWSNKNWASKSQPPVVKTSIFGGKYQQYLFWNPTDRMVLTCLHLTSCKIAKHFLWQHQA